MISEHPTAIEEIVNTFQSQQMPNVNRETQSWILMEILGAIPEEVKYSIIFKKNRNQFESINSRVFVVQIQQTNVMYTSVQRVTIQNEICKRTPFVISTVQQFILSKLEQNISDDDMATLLRAVKCAEAWLKSVILCCCLSFDLVLINFGILSISKGMEVFLSTIVKC